MQRDPVIIAVCGKGGVGKTSISALIVRMFVKTSAQRVLAIDADPAMGLSYALGVTVSKTVDRIRTDLIEKLAGKTPMNREEQLRQLDYDLFSALCERENLAFLAIGRPEGDGCYCRVNQLLRELITQIAARFDIVVIDAEAGLEQINRRVMEMVTHLLIVSDGSLKGRKVAIAICGLAQKRSFCKNSGLIFNRLQDSAEDKAILAQNPLPLVHVMHENDLIRTFDRDGRPILNLAQSEELEAFEASLRQFCDWD